MSPDEDLRAARGVRVAVEAFQWTFARSSGAGGQSVNKTSTKATLAILLSDIQCSPTVLARLEKSLPETVSVTSQVYRSQWRNRFDCMELLCKKLNEASAPPPAPRRKTKPSRGAIERRLNSKRIDSEKKRNRRVTE
jgi:ribosome-associated protein